VVNQVEMGRLIRQARERISMSQEDFALAAGKDQRAMSEYENGKRKIPATELANFAAILNVPISYFYEGDFQIDALDQMMLSEFHKLPTLEARQAALRIVRIFSTTLHKHISAD